jgi:hypothetical protein
LAPGCTSHRASWPRFRAAIVAALAELGGNGSAGYGSAAMLRAAGLREVRRQVAVVALPGRHPCMRLPMAVGVMLRERILAGELLSETELDAALAEGEQATGGAERASLSFTVSRVWGRKPRS